MTVDITIAPHDLSGACQRQIATITGPVLYAAGGVAIDPTQFRMGKVFAILGGIASDGTTLYNLWYNVATQKLMWFVSSTGIEAGAIDLHTVTARVEVVGQ